MNKKNIIFFELKNNNHSLYFNKINFSTINKNIDINFLFDEDEKNYYDELLNSLSHFYNLENEKKIPLLNEINFNDVKFLDNIYQLIFFKKLFIKNSPKNYKECLIKLELEMQKIYQESKNSSITNLKNYKISELLKEIYFNFEKKIKSHFNNQFDFNLFPYGSITEFLNSGESDLDVYLDLRNIVDHKKGSFINNLYNFVKTEIDNHAKLTISTRLCVLSLRYKYGNVILNLDLSILGLCPFLHSVLVRKYSLLDARFPILMICLKELLKILRINNKDDNYYLNTFTWSLLLITFLQDIINPPILPKLLKNSKGKNSFIRFGKNFTLKKVNKTTEDFIKNSYLESTKIPLDNFQNFKEIYNNEIKSKEKKNEMTVSEILIKFLEFVIFYFKYNTLYVNVSFDGENFDNISNIYSNDNKSDFEFKKYFIYKYMKFKGIENERDGFLLARDPFDSHYNPGQTLKANINNFVEKLILAYFTLIEKGSFDEIKKRLIKFEYQ